MSVSAKATPRKATKGFRLEVMPNDEDLQDAIAANGQCSPTECWHFMAINKLLERLAPGERHMVKVDAGHVKCNLRGWQYIADTPRHVKRSLMLFDQGRYDKVYVRQYRLSFRRLRQVEKMTAERKAQINRNRAARIANGGDERRRKYPNLRARVEGFSGIV